MLILHEEKYAESLYYGNNDDIKSTVAKIGYVTRYLMHSLGCSNEDNYNITVEWMKYNHSNFDESTYSNLISDAIKRAKKNPFYNIDSIKITISELEAISTLEDVKAEKVLFVLLCMAKLQAISYGFTGGLVKYSLSDLCKMARISVPTEEREYILYNIIQTGLLGYPKKNNTQCLFVNFIDNDGEVAISLTENNCKELAYEYLNWKNGGIGYDRCELCGNILKQSKSNPKRFCRECTEIVGCIDKNTKVIRCEDCGDLVYIPVLNTKTCRCEGCQKNVLNENWKEASQRYRESKKASYQPQNPQQYKINKDFLLFLWCCKFQNYFFPNGYKEGYLVTVVCQYGTKILHNRRGGVTCTTLFYLTLY